MLSNLMKMGSDARAKVAAEVSKFRNRSFMEAVAAGCAGMAMADGIATPDEKQKMMGYVQRADELKAFEQKDIVSFFQKTCDNYEFDRAFGRMEALKIIGRVRKDPEQARAVLRVIIIIASADGRFDDDEKVFGREVATELGLNPADFGL